jgi:hypothetical protein
VKRLVRTGLDARVGGGPVYTPRMALPALVLGLRILAADAPPPAETPYLYRARLVQAAPGRLLDLVALEKSLAAGFADSGDEPPLAMRHSQGDKWDLLVLYPLGSFPSHFASDRVARRDRWRERERAALAKEAAAVAWQEDVYVWGPPVARVRDAFGKAGLFHVEMFVALPGRVAELVRQRDMENAYDRALGLPQNLVFTREAGAAWDVFTVGCFRDLKHYAESGDATPAAQDAAARGAGFDGAKAIGPYLRTLIREHHDTLATAPW